MNNPKQILFLTLLAITSVIPCSTMQAAHIKLSLQPMMHTKEKGKKLPAVFLGEPFVLIVTVTHNNTNQHPVTIDNIKEFAKTGQQSSSNVAIVNGALTATSSHTYQMVPQKEGIFTIGPASTVDHNKDLTSNSVELAVIKRPKDFQRKEADNPDDAITVTATLSAAKKEVVVGEPLSVVFTVQLQGPVLELSQSQFEFPGFITKKPTEAIKREETIDGIPTIIFEQPFLLIPTQAGNKVLDPIKAVYAYRSQGKNFGHRSSMSAFSNFFDDLSMNRMRQKEAVSNELPIKVKPLPATKKSINGVGVFEAQPMTVDKTSAQENEPILLSLSIHGQGNLDQMSSPRLSLPSGWKAYESSSKVINSSETTEMIEGEKRFDYILQIPNAGEWDIPDQQFSFYNTETEKVATLTIPGIAVTVTPGERESQGSTSAQPPSNPSSGQTTSPETHKQDIHFIHDDHPTSSSGFSWWVFLLLLLSPLLLIAPSIVAYINQKSQTRKKRLAALASRIMRQLEENKCDNIYPLFKQFIALKYDYPLHSLTHEAIEELLRHDTLEEEKISECIDFFNECAQAHFVKSHTSLDQKSIIKKGKYWIVFLST